MSKPQIKAFYLCVKNMDRAVGFYEWLFARPVDKKDERMSLFEFENFSFLLFDPKKDQKKVVWGNNAIINIQVEDLEKYLKKIKQKKLKIVLPKQKINQYSLFQFKDTEGNVVEVYEVV